MLGCQNRCQTYTGYYQSHNPNPNPPPLPQHHFPTPPANAYATAPASYLFTPQTYPVAPQYAIPMSSYAVPHYAVVPQYPVAYPTPPSYVRPPPVYVTRPPVYVTPPPTTTTTTTTTTIPPPRCFQNAQGFKCCSRLMDQFLDMKVVEMQRPEWQRCNLQRFATQLQMEAQSVFNHSMESIVSSGHMENLSMYRGDLYCKKRSPDGKVVVLYGSAVPYALDGSTRPMNETELRNANYPPKYDDIGIHDGHEDNIW
uniref:Ground-like domain-containing protein n=1 Tax=Caenorhabditis japonica TaxID=281687 RepID=A0A8R1DSJ1_CAEJA